MSKTLEIKDYLNKIENASELDFSRDYFYFLLEYCKRGIRNYLQAQIIVNKGLSEELLEEVSLFNEKAQRLADEKEVLFSPLDVSTIEKNLNAES